jgi:hypothetical protein
VAIDRGGGFGDAVGDFGDLQDRVGFGANAFEFSSAVERSDPVAQIVVGQSSSVVSVWTMKRQTII